MTNPHPLFDALWYVATYPEARESGMSPLEHYLSRGDAAGFWPNPLFDPVHYGARVPQLPASEGKRLLHYVVRRGQDADPNPLFDSHFYLEGHPEVRRSAVNPLIHYLDEGAREFHAPHPLFDARWYFETYRAVEASGLDPLAHYLWQGWKLGYDPHPLFDSAWYLERYGPFEEGDMAPPLHYLRYGASRGFSPSPFFDPLWYLNRYRVQPRPGRTPFEHWLVEGLPRSQRPGPLFDLCVRCYRDADPGHRARGRSPLAGFLDEERAPMSAPCAELPVVLPDTDAPLASVVLVASRSVAPVLACLRSLSATQNRTPFEVVVVDDEPDRGDEALPEIPRLRVLRNERRLGLPASRDRGAAAARSDELVFLDDATIVTDGWLDELLATRLAFPDAGLVGSRLLWPNGRVREVGRVVWCDGSASAVGREEESDDPRYRFARPADQVSCAAISLDRKLLERIGGFEKADSPPSCRDADLAFRVREAGWDVVVQPASTVVHLGDARGSEPRRAEAEPESPRSWLTERWSAALTFHPEPGGDLLSAARRRSGRRALVMDARMLTPDQDSGSLRMFNMLRLLRGLGFAPTFVPANFGHLEAYATQLERIGVEVACSPAWTSVQDVLEQEGSRFDLCWLSRPEVASLWLETVGLLCPRAVVLYDMVDIHFLRREREMSVRGRSALPPTQKEDELLCCRQADGVIAVSDFDRERILAEDGSLPVHVLSNIHEVHPLPVPFAERRDVLFIGGFQHAPNVDAVLWFVREVLPLVHERLPDLGFHVIGSEMPEEIEALASDRVRIEGYVSDVSPFFASCRLSVAPLRYGSGVKGKINQSMSFGMPCVATSIAAEGMQAKDGSEILIADDAESFAESVVRLYTEEPLWRELSVGSVHSVERTFSMEVAEQRLREILKRFGLV